MTSPHQYSELSNPQRRIWLTELMHNHLDMSNIGYLIHFHSPYDLPLLAKAVQAVVKANKGLQLRFKPSETDHTELLQYIPDFREIDIPIIHARDHAHLLQLIENKHRERFDLSSGDYLCAFAVFSIENGPCGFYEKAHHLVADGLSAIVVARETLETYNRMSNGDFSEISKEHDYLAFLASEHEYLHSDRYARDKEYWSQRFESCPCAEISFVQNQNAANSLLIKRCSFTIPQDAVARLEIFKTHRRIANFHMFMAALAIYLNRYMDHPDIVIGMPVHNRSQKIFRDMAGMFVSTLPFRIEYNEQWSFDDLIAYIKKELWDDLKHQSYPYNHLVRDLKAQGADPGGFLNLQLIELPEVPLQDVASRYFFSTRYNISQLSIYLNQQSSKELVALDVAIDCHADLFSDEDVEALFRRLLIILEQGVAEPQRPIADLSLLEDSERQQLLYELNPPPTDYPRHKTLTALFSEQALRSPAAIALEYEGMSLNYSRLDSLSDHIAAQLQAAGLKPGAIAGILCERSPEAVLAILAILKSGAAYLPIDPGYPPERIRYIIENSQIQALIVDPSSSALHPDIPSSHPRLAIFTADWRILQNLASTLSPAAPNITPDLPAYVIYTSGTTGNPKGTALSHRNAVNYIWWGAKVYSQGEKTDFPLFTSLSFDLTVTSIFIPLITGNKIIIYRDYADGLLIQQVLKENRVDIIKLTPSHFKIVLQSACPTDRIKAFIVGGEELKTETAAAVFRHFNGNIRIYNEYGPTETTVGCMIHLYDPTRDTGAAVPIGVPADNAFIYILDKLRRPLPTGVTGEIYIGGEGVAIGYLHNPALTAERFLDNPFIPGARMYKSGDLGRWNRRFILEYAGRCDEQVKIRGHRIEPGEIECRLMKIPNVRDAVVTVKKATQPELCAWLTSSDNSPLSAASLREALTRDLPLYMIPSEFIQVDAIPLTRNGKVDMRKLLTLGKRLESAQSYQAPSTENEIITAAVWAEVLGLEQVGVLDNFFELGGDSIKAVQIAAKLNDRGKTVGVRDILARETIASLCAHTDMDRRQRSYEQGPLSGDKPFTPIEHWFFSQNFPCPGHFHQSVLLEFKTPVPPATLSAALTQLIRHHDALRLNLRRDRQALFFNPALLESPADIAVLDLSHLPPERRAAEIAEAGYALKHQFDIYNGPLIRGLLLTAAGERDKFLLVLHHLASDGLTLRIILEDLAALCPSDSTLPMPPLPKKTASPADWSDALILFRDSGRLEQEKSYWPKMNNPAFRLPCDHDPDSADWSMRHMRSVSLSLSATETEFLLKDAHQAYNTDVRILATAAAVTALADWSHAFRVTLEMENHGRFLDNIDVSRSTGWFTAMFPISFPSDSLSPDYIIKNVKETLRLIPNDGAGYGILKYMSGNPAPAPQRPQFRFNYLGRFDHEVENPLFSYLPQNSGSDSALDNHITAVMEMNAMILSGKFQGEIRYNSQVFQDETVNRFAANYIQYFRKLLEHIRQQDSPQFTPSDFDAANLNQDDLSALFGD